jgi:hypothetical protein
MKKMRFLMLMVAASMLAMTAQGQKLSELTRVSAADTGDHFAIVRIVGSTKSTATMSIAKLKTYIQTGMGTVTTLTASVTPTSVFSVTVTNPTTTPHVAIAMVPAAAYSVLCNTANATGVPFYAKVNLATMTVGAVPAAQLPATTAGYVWMGGSGGTTTGQPLSGDVTISSAGVVSHTVTGVSAGTYGGASSIPEITVDAKGRITAATSHSVTPASVTPTNTVTFTNKRWTARVSSATTVSATPAVNTDNFDVVKYTAQTATITSMTTNLTGTPVDGDIICFELTAGSGTPGITWGASFVNSSVTAPIALSTTTQTVLYRYSTSSSYGANKWVCAKVY